MSVSTPTTWAPVPEAGSADPSPHRLVPRVLRSLARSRPGPGRVRVVGIDGRSGSGKTDLAVALAARLPATVVHLDDLYVGWHGLADALPAVCADLLVPLAAGRPGRYRRYDWVAGRPAELVTVPPADLVVIEGVGALAVDCVAEYALRVWLDAPPETRRRRALARDGDTFAPHWQEWADQEDQVFAQHPARAAADLVLDTA